MPRVVLDEFLAWQLNALQEQGLLRDPEDASAREQLERAAAERGDSVIDACSNDYLNLARGLDVSRETARAGAGAARLVQGSWPEHRDLEHELAEWVGVEDALLFASGYAANLGTISALGGTDHAVLSDELNHASIIDGCRLSRARIAVIPHLDLAALETALAQSAAATARWVVSESYFSMDGDGPDLGALRALCDRHRAFLVVDEAHALGVFGPNGSGRCAELGVKPDVLMGTLGKAVGTQGAFAAGSEHLRTFLWNRARSFVFSTGTSPALAATTLTHVKRTRGADSARATLRERAQQLRELFIEAGVSLVPNSFGPIVSAIAGRSDAALAVAHRLRASGILAQAIRPPTVAPGQARVRFTVTAAMTTADVDRIAAAAAAAFESES
jgi:8-amino-7-oxononanoate synthase